MSPKRYPSLATFLAWLKYIIGEPRWTSCWSCPCQTDAKSDAILIDRCSSQVRRRDQVWSSGWWTTLDSIQFSDSGKWVREMGAISLHVVESVWTGFSPGGGGGTGPQFPYTWHRWAEVHDDDDFVWGLLRAGGWLDWKLDWEQVQANNYSFHYIFDNF